MTPQTAGGATFGLSAITSALAGFGQIKSGQDQKAAYDYNATVTMENAADQDAVVAEQTAVLTGRQATAYAASGVDIASGSPLLIMAASRARGAVKGEQIEQAASQEATLQRYYGAMAAWGGTMSGINTFLSGISKASSTYAGAFPPSLSPTPTTGSWTEAD